MRRRTSSGWKRDGEGIAVVELEGVDLGDGESGVVALWAAASGAAESGVVEPGELALDASGSVVVAVGALEPGIPAR